jgi:acyl-CoA dehydrogenase
MLDTRGLVFTDVKVPAKYRLGAEGDDSKSQWKAFDHTRPPVAAGAVGVAKAAMNHAMEY